MDFFQRQDLARRHTKRLVIYFILAVVLIVLGVYLVSTVAFAFAVGYGGHRAVSVHLWDPRLFLWVSGGTMAVIFFGSLFKMFELSAGGVVIATNLGGQLINPSTTDPDERKLLNVVEEMAIASGVPMPQVYRLARERGINAFAAGRSPSDAVIGVTDGCMRLLSRDELQGVIGHEFSHLLNGDMRLNLRLIALLSGILGVAYLGRLALYSYDPDSRQGNAAINMAGIALILLGWIGVFFGSLIKAAVSRQREFLADASSVQFTRNPAGISGALKKIGGLNQGSRLITQHAAEASHMYFGNGLQRSWIHVFDTHPPLTARIRAIDPSFDGRFPEVAPLAPPAVAAAPPGLAIGGLAGMMAGLAGGQTTSGVNRGVAAHAVTARIGTMAPHHLAYAADFRERVPPALLDAAHEPLAAMVMVYGLLLSREPALRSKQLSQLTPSLSPPAAAELPRLLPAIDQLDPALRLPLVLVALGTLKQLSPPQFVQFEAAVEFIIHSDAQIELFEFTLQKMIRRHLAPHFGPQPRRATQYYNLRLLQPDCAVLFSALARLGGQDAANQERSFRAAAAVVADGTVALEFLPLERCGIAALGPALDRLAQASPQLKRLVLDAAARLVAEDNVVHEAEAELLRAVADTLDCPMPPFIEGV